MEYRIGELEKLMKNFSSLMMVSAIATNKIKPGVFEEVQRGDMVALEEVCLSARGDPNVRYLR